MPASFIEWIELFKVGLEESEILDDFIGFEDVLISCNAGLRLNELQFECIKKIID